MRFLTFLPLIHSAFSTNQIPLTTSSTLPTARRRPASAALFNELEELSRVVDITYCVGSTNTGISKPFTCLSRCSAFPSFELITTWNTGPLFSDSCGFIALSHAPAKPRIIVAFRGTYSIANTIVDLATIPQAYLPYPTSNDTHDDEPECEDCSVHLGFYNSWRATSETVTPHLESLKAAYPDYELTLVGHSLGGAITALAGLEFQNRRWQPTVTTFGEPRIGNAGLARYFDRRFGFDEDCPTPADIDPDDVDIQPKVPRYRRVTHVDDPVPLLPLSEWGYVPHGGELFIDKSSLPPAVGDLYHCCGDADSGCIAGQDESLAGVLQQPVDGTPGVQLEQAVQEMASMSRSGFGVPSRYKLWQLLFAHRDYFWRLGLCLPDFHFKPFSGL